MISLTETVQQSLANHQPTKPTQEKDKFGEPEEEELERCFKQDVSIVDDGVNNLHLDLRHALRVPNKVKSLTFPLVLFS